MIFTCCGGVLVWASLAWTTWLAECHPMPPLGLLLAFFTRKVALILSIFYCYFIVILLYPGFACGAEGAWKVNKGIKQMVGFLAIIFSPEV